MLVQNPAAILAPAVVKPRGYETMKFLFDQSADFRLIPLVRDLGHDVTAIARDYPHGMTDADVLDVARREERILVVADLDFGELVFQQGLGHAGIVLLRLPEVGLQEKARQLESVLAKHEDNLLRGEFLVVTDGHVRIANRPPR
jgi:predicted nuclease of predicted toxin-antitoxin system